MTITNSGFSTTAAATVNTFTPVALSVLPIPGYANNVDVVGNYAYVAAGSAGLQIVNVSDRFAPAIVASWDTPGNANDVKVSGNLAFVADGTAGLQIINITNPTSPTFVGAVDTPFIASRLAVSGNYVFIADGQSLQVVDITNAANPVIAASIGAAGTEKGVDVSGNRAIVANGSDGVFVLDISTPSNPVLLGSLDTPGDARGVALSNNVGYVADYTGSLQIIDISDPAAPNRIGSTAQSLGGILVDVAYSGDFAFGADVFFNNNGVSIIFVRNPSNPIARARLDFTGSGADLGTGIAVDSSYVYRTASQTLEENGVTGSTRLYIGQYLSLSDTNGNPPDVQITSLISGDTLIERSAVPITVSATDDVQVASVSFLVNGQVVFTDTSRPFEYAFTVPVGVQSMTLRASAIDLGNNVGLSDEVQVNVIPDPLTTVTGFVVDENGQAVDGAVVTTAGGLFATTSAGGSFSIPGVPTVFGNIKVLVSFTAVDGTVSQGSSEYLSPVRGGITNVGEIPLSSCLVMNPLPVSGWPAEGDGVDVYGLNDGLLLNGVTFAHGVVGQAFSFDGVDDFVSIPSSATLNISGPLTVEAWFNLSDIPINFPAIVTKGPTNAQYLLFVNALGGDASGTAPVCFRINTGPNNPTSRFDLSLQTICSISKVIFGQYMHVAGVFEGESIRIYVNGQLEASLPVAGTIASDDRPLIIGAGDGILYGEGLVNRVHGMIDEVGIYNRALTSTEIQEIFTAGGLGLGKCRP